MINNYGRLNLVLPIVQSPPWMFGNKQIIWAFFVIFDDGESTKGTPGART